MPAVEDFYKTLIKDPDLEIGEGKTREEAAMIEAEYRARQHANNVQALALATEPLKEESGLKSLLNYVTNLSKYLVSGSISIAQDLLKAHKEFSNYSSAVDGWKSQNLTSDQNNHEKNQIAQLGDNGKAFFANLEKSGVPI